MADQRAPKIDANPAPSLWHKPWTFLALCLATNAIVFVTTLLVMPHYLHWADKRQPQPVAAQADAATDEVIPVAVDAPNDLPAPPLLTAESATPDSNGVVSEALPPPTPLALADVSQALWNLDVPVNEETETPDSTTPPAALTPAYDVAAASAAEQQVADNTIVAQEEPEVLLQGPLHEAFGEPAAYEDTTELALAPQEPPAPIEEYPPDEQPVAATGQSVVWIPGYWHWDGDRHGHIWQCGMWRVAPWGCRWVPGYWHRAPAGWWWVNGFWATSDRPLQYIVLAPPVSYRDSDPWTLPHNWDSIWVPGHCVFVGSQYVWQRGYWMTPRPDRVWVPPHYVHTPRGYVFVGGYWDYPMEQRGVMFAPVWFPVGGHRPFRPSIVIATTRLPECLFVSPVHRRYYFGDYFDMQRRTALRLHPWYERQGDPTSGWHDPLYAHYRSVQMREDRAWERRLRTAYEYRTNHEEARPRHVYQPAPAVARDMRQPAPLAAPLASEAPAVRGTPVPPKFRVVSAERRDQILAEGRKLHEYAENRRITEEAAAPVRARPTEVARRPTVVDDRVRPAPVPADQVERRQETIERPAEQRKDAEPARPSTVERPKLGVGERTRVEAEKRTAIRTQVKVTPDTPRVTDRSSQDVGARARQEQATTAEQARQQQETTRRNGEQRAAAERLKQQQEAERLKSEQEAVARARQDAEAKARSEQAQRAKREADDRAAQESARKLKAEQDAAQRAKEQQVAAERARQQQEVRQREAEQRAKQQQEAEQRTRQQAAEKARQQQAAEQAKQAEAAEQARRQAVAEQTRQKEATERARQQQEAAERSRQQQAAADEARRKEAAEQARQQQEAAQRAKEQQAAAERARQQQEAKQREAEQRARQQEAEQRARQQRETEERARQQREAEQRAAEQRAKQQQQEAEQRARQQETEQKARQQRDAEDRARQQREAEQRARQQEQQNKNQGNQRKGR